MTTETIDEQLSHLERWKRLDNYIGADHSEWFVAYSRVRDSGLLDQSNYDAVLKRLGGESDTVVVIQFSHWAWGWVDVILVHENDKDRLVEANEILRYLAEDYPILDEDHYEELLHEETLETVEEIKKYPDDYEDVPSEETELYNYARDIVISNL